MYKVFINEKKLILSETPQSVERNIAFEENLQFDIALDLLQNTSTKDAAIYYHDVEALWTKFQEHYQVIEAAGGIVLNPEKKILFIYRLGKWDLPKGKIEKGESSDIAALREVEEECGLTNLELKNFINTTFHMYQIKSKPVLKKTYWYYMEHDGVAQPKPQVEEGITKVEWKNKVEIQRDVETSTFNNILLILGEFLSKHEIS
ncbi:NUDIX domain-containing protein [Soonwooa sp.]|uniref:NUDIX hydrolase n=1 Tax=Soonwooa sp. TaxID=1938592 RepID=UPI002614D08E|nr:NUDIX domain-containing protein [Soonwooa sp.]